MNGSELHRELLDLARNVGRESAQFVAAERDVATESGTGRVDVTETKSSPTDVVTAIDQANEDLIRRRVLAARPGDGFLGEEGESIEGSSGVRWVVDPIDGTVNFVYGLPFYAVSIGVEVHDVVVAGYVINVATGEEFEAVIGEGAWTHESGRRSRLVAPEAPGVSEALVGTGFNYVVEVRAKQADAAARLLRHVRDVRRTGSAALDLCNLAAGRLDAYVEQGLKPWDLAAGGLIAAEAGVQISGLDGIANERLVMAAHPSIAREFFELVHACGF